QYTGSHYVFRGTIHAKCAGEWLQWDCPPLRALCTLLCGISCPYRPLYWDTMGLFRLVFISNLFLGFRLIESVLLIQPQSINNSCLAWGSTGSILHWLLLQHYY